jgi:hypothetical protein
MTDVQPSQVAGTAKDQGAQVASTAVDQGRQTAGAAADAGAQVASAGVEGARQVAAETATQAGEVTRQAAEQARGLVEQAQAQLRDQADSQAQRAAGGLRDVGRQVRALSEGGGEEAGPAADVARQLGQKIEELAGRLEERGVDGTVDDVREFARRRPGVFLLGAAAAGFAVTRLGRGLQFSQQAQRSQQGGPPSGAADSPLPPPVAAPTAEAPAPPAASPTIGGW